MSDQEQPVRVTIFGEEYTIRSDMAEAYTRACAEHVDRAIQEAHLHSHVSEPHKAAILAALEITDELFRTRAERNELLHAATERAAELRRRVEEALDG